MKKEYLISEFNIDNTYCIEKIYSVNSFEKWCLVSDRYNRKYVLLIENINSNMPNINELYFNIKYDELLIYPVDISVGKSELYIYNQIGFIYPGECLVGYRRLSDIKLNTVQDKIKVLNIIVTELCRLHNKEIYLDGIDMKQIFITDDLSNIKIRYSRYFANSIYKVPKELINDFNLIVRDYYSLFVLAFEILMNWHPFYGALTGFSEDDRYINYVYQSEHLYIFHETIKDNLIGVFTEHMPIISKYNNLNIECQKIFYDFFTFKKKLNSMSERELCNQFLNILKTFTLSKADNNERGVPDV